MKQNFGLLMVQVPDFTIFKGKVVPECKNSSVFVAKKRPFSRNIWTTTNLRAPPSVDVFKN